MSNMSNGTKDKIAALPLVVALLTGSAAAQTPQISSVAFTGSAGHYALTITGTGFGSPAATLPFTGDMPNFRIVDNAQVGFGEWGYMGDANVLTYRSWTNNRIVVSGLGAQPGDALTMGVWNQTSQLGGAWGGNVPTTGSTPKITGVEMSGTGANLEILVYGSGFGAAPPNLPPFASPADLDYFRFTDLRSHCGSGSTLFEAGFQGWNINQPTPVTLYYTSWSDNTIVVSGFAGSYGQGCATYQPGDPVTVVVYNTADTSDTGAQTAWGGPPAAHIGITVEDVTTGLPISPGGSITGPDQFQVTVTGGPELDCAGQFVVTAVGSGGTVPPALVVQAMTFVFQPAVAPPSVTGAPLPSGDATFGAENDWKITASCNGSTQNSFAFSSFEFTSALPGTLP
jgi:hypothetical protein